MRSKSQNFVNFLLGTQSVPVYEVSKTCQWERIERELFPEELEQFIVYYVSRLARRYMNPSVPEPFLWFTDGMFMKAGGRFLDFHYRHFVQTLPS